MNYESLNKNPRKWEATQIARLVGNTNDIEIESYTNDFIIIERERYSFLLCFNEDSIPQIQYTETGDMVLFSAQIEPEWHTAIYISAATAARLKLILPSADYMPTNSLCVDMGITK